MIPENAPHFASRSTSPLVVTKRYQHVVDFGGAVTAKQIKQIIEDVPDDAVLSKISTDGSSLRLFFQPKKKKSSINPPRKSSHDHHRTAGKTTRGTSRLG